METKARKTKAPKVIVIQDQETGIEDDIIVKKHLHENINEQLSTIGSVIKNLKAVEINLKNTSKECKKDSKVKKRVIPEEEKERRRATSGFNKPVEVSETLLEFMGASTGSKVSRVEVTKNIIAYIKSNDLQKGRNFDVDEKLLGLLGEPVYLLNSKHPECGYGYSYFSLPKYLSKHYVKKENLV